MGRSSRMGMHLLCKEKIEGSSPFRSTTGYSSVWLERMAWDHEVSGSNPLTPTIAEMAKLGKRSCLKSSSLEVQILFSALAGVAKLADAHDLGSCSLTRSVGSNPISCTSILRRGDGTRYTCSPQKRDFVGSNPTPATNSKGE